MDRAQWHFREFKPGDSLSDPDFAKALFSHDSEQTLARSIVRESVQNSLDAGVAADTPVRVRFVVRTGAKALEASQVGPFFEGGWEHLHAKKTGLAHPPSPRERVPFLAVEDFGTTGLIGDPGEWQPFRAAGNAFFLFFRALGRSAKEATDRGRWGVGKFVFPLASRGNCLLGLTVTSERSDPVLMGRMVLKTHEVGANSYHPDGHWGYRSLENPLVMPIEARRRIQDFRDTFGLQRDNEPGLSVVVPWLADDITAQGLTLAALSEYFLPILRGELEIEIDDNGHAEEINAETIAAMADTVEPRYLRGLLNLAVEVATWPTNKLLRLPDGISDNVEWHEEVIPDGIRADLLKTLDAGAPIGVRVPVTVQQKSAQESRQSYFDVFLQRAYGVGRQRPLIVREGITVPEDKTLFLQDHVALVVVDDEALATMVGDAENPAHTELQTELIRDKYRYAPKTLKFLRQAPAALIRALETSSVADDPFLLAEFFPVNTDTDPSSIKVGAGSKKKKKETTSVVPPIPRTPPRFRISRIERGFRVSGAEDSTALPEELTIRFAYDVRRGNPFKRYSPVDFSMLRDELNLAVTNASIVSTQDNLLVIQPGSNDFDVRVSGFDPQRNVVVRVTAPTTDRE